MSSKRPATQPSRPSVNHLVLAVRDIEASHRFYCDVLGFEQCGTFNSSFQPNPVMRFYRGHPDHHHDIALQEIPDPATAPPVPAGGIFDAALSYFEPLPRSGPEALQDSTDYVRFNAHA
jgi:catechol 2,3-dioxygenase-like lactoylglutathione lyase family enzyme